MIRQATLADLEAVCALVFRASQFVFEAALINADFIEQEKLFNDYYRSKTTKFSYCNTLVYEKDGNIVGCIVGYPATVESEYNQIMQTFIETSYRFPKEAIDESYYIDSLAVAENHEGKVLPKKLIQTLSEWTSLPLSLVVEEAKPQVKAYYERLGFEAKAPEEMFGMMMYPMIRK